MSITVFANITETTATSVVLQEVKTIKCVVVGAGDLSLFIHSREKALEIASLLESAAQKWEDEA